MPTGVHELFIDGTEDAIRSQLKEIHSRSHSAASFTQKSKHESGASFWHDYTQYPGVTIKVAYSHKRKRLAHLAEDYLLDSNASVRVVVRVGH